MKLEITARKHGLRMLWTDGQTSYMARGMRFLAADTGLSTVWRGGSVGGVADKVAASIRVTRQLTRSGIHHFWPLPDGSYFVVIRKRALRVDPDGRPEEVFRFERGNKPAQRGVCVTPEGQIFMGEYALNPDRDVPVVVYRSDDHGRSFKPVKEFAPGQIRHTHFLQWDSYSKCIWMGTGDSDNECWVYRSSDLGESWETIGGGGQKWRAVGVSFRPEAVYWGTDAGSDAGKHPNYVMRLDRESLQLEEALEIQGPCHGNASLRDGTLLVSTGVEGGANEKDHYAHLWASRDGKSWQEIAKFAKDRLPGILQYGVIRFPQGIESSDLVAFTAMGLRGAGECTFVGTLLD